MTDLNLDEIEQRCNAATKGPWIATTECKGYDHPIDCVSCEFSRHNDVARILHKHTAANIYTRANINPYRESDCLDDAEFIAHARTDVPALIARVRQLEERIEWLNGKAANETSSSSDKDLKAEVMGAWFPVVLPDVWRF